MKKISVILLLLAISLGSLFAYSWYVQTKLVQGEGYITTKVWDVEGYEVMDDSWYYSDQSKNFTESRDTDEPLPDLFTAEGLGDYDEVPAGEIGSHHYLYISDPDGPKHKDLTIPPFY